MEFKLIRKSPHRRITEAVFPETVKTEHAEDGRLMYRFRGELFTPGELADLLEVRQ